VDTRVKEDQLVHLDLGVLEERPGYPGQMDPQGKLDQKDHQDTRVLLVWLDCLVSVVHRVPRVTKEEGEIQDCLVLKGLLGRLANVGHRE